MSATPDAQPAESSAPARLSPALATLDTLVGRLVDNRARVAALEAEAYELYAAAVDVIAARFEELQARRRRTIASDLPAREVTAELAAALRMGERAIGARLGDAAQLSTRYQDTRTALAEGRIDTRHVAVILDAGTFLSTPEHHAAYQAQILPIAQTETPARLRPLAREIAARIDPDGAADRAQNAQDHRKITLQPLDDDLARLMLDLPATLAHAIYDRLTQMAKAVKNAPVPATPDGGTSGDDAAREGEDARATQNDDDTRVVAETGPTATVNARAGTNADAGTNAGAAVDAQDPADQPDPRTLDQIRADIAADLLLTAGPTAYDDALAAITAIVQVTVPLDALDRDAPTGRATGPAMLTGHGPIPIGTARTLAGHTPGWERVCLDPDTGLPIAVDRYKPSARQKAFLKARDEHCRFPGCMRPVVRCELDHTLDAAKGGATCICNLAHFCKRHHTLKHHTDWTVTQIGAGTLRWTSPTGRTHIDRPVTTVRFTPDPVPVAPRADQPPTDQAPADQPPADQAPAGEAPAGEAPAGQAPAGEAPAGEAPAGEAPTGQALPGQARPDQAPHEQEPTGNERPGQARPEHAHADQSSVGQSRSQLPPPIQPSSGDMAPDLRPLCTPPPDDAVPPF